MIVYDVVFMGCVFFIKSFDVGILFSVLRYF